MVVALVPLLQRWRVHVLMNVAFPTATKDWGFLVANPTKARSTILPPKSVSVTPEKNHIISVAATHSLEYVVSIPKAT